MPKQTIITPLGKLAELRTGFQLRGSTASLPEGRTLLVQSGDISTDYPVELNGELLNPFVEEPTLVDLGSRVKPWDFLQAHDILLRSRGANYGATWVTVSNRNEPVEAVAVAPLYVLRLTQPQKIDPAYLCWFINRPDVQAYLRASAQGTTSPYVSVGTLAELPIVVPPLELQKQFLEVHALQQQEQQLTRVLRSYRSQLLRALLDNRTGQPELFSRYLDLDDPFAEDTFYSPTMSTLDITPEHTVTTNAAADATLFDDLENDPLLPDAPPPTGNPVRDREQEIKQKQINDALWKACDTFRGIIDPEAYKSYVLPMLFLKYISDVWWERHAEMMAQYDGDTEIVDRQMELEGFVLPAGATFQDVYKQANADNLGEVIDKALQAIEDENPEKLKDVFRNVTYNSDNLGETKERNIRLRHLLDDFAALDLRPSRVNEDIVGGGYMFLVEKFAADAGKKAGEFFTPREVSILLAKLVRPRPGDRICDPTCGSGSLLIRVANEIEGDAHERHDYSLYGQEMNGSTWALCCMNMFLHREESAVIEWGDTLRNPKLKIDDDLMRFNVVVANPPFSLDKWGAENAPKDRYQRFKRGVPPRSKGDYAFILHMVETALERQGRVGVIVPHGVLFRGQGEGRIRQSLLEDNLLDTVIGLPEKLFFGTDIPAAILIFDRAREAGGAREAETDVLFIDASREYSAVRNQTLLREKDIAQIVETHRLRREEARYSRRVPREEIAENEYNLNIARYIDTFVAAPTVNIMDLQQEINALEMQLADVRTRLSVYLKELEVAGL